LQDRQREGAFTCTILPSEIAVFCTILDNITMKDYFSMLNSSVPLQCTEGLIIRVQPNTYIEKTEHFWTALHLVKERVAEQRLQQPRGMGNSAKLCRHLLCCLWVMPQTTLAGLPLVPVCH
jgi:hypothetical protein